MGQGSFFDVENRLQSVSKMGDPLEHLASAIPWESFRTDLQRVHEKERKSNAGRKPLDVVLMFKVLILQSLYNLSDEQVEYQVRDRLSFARFLGLGIEDEVPDESSVWRFRERLKALGLIDVLFNRFGDYLAAEGYQAKQGQIVDASIVPVPIQRNSREENRRIKAGEVPEDWSEAKRKQKDVEARWTRKNGKSAFGYKNHIDVDAEHKLIRTYEVTPANVHDSQVLDELVDPDNEDPRLWADSAYRSEETESVLGEAGYHSHICEKGQSGQPLSEEQQATNRRRSKVRSRVEHIFGFQQNSMGGKFIRTIGIARAVVKIGLMNLTYNLMRYLQQPYYVGLLSAAAIHGAAHEQPMAFQVMTSRPVREMRSGRVVLRLSMNRRVEQMPVIAVQTETGTMRVATPETTAFDLVRYPAEAGHLSNAATVLAELAERVDADALARLAPLVRVPDVQRLGYLLEVVGEHRLAEPLADWLSTRKPRRVPLKPGSPADVTPDQRWRVLPNEDLEL
jgi:IS5 family transposase